MKRLCPYAASLLLLLGLPVVAVPAIADTVYSVHDGDTLTALDGAKRVRVRLACIDAPELGQRPWGKEAKNFLQVLLPKGSTVQLRQVATDRYGRTVAEDFKGLKSLGAAPM